MFSNNHQGKLAILLLSSLAACGKVNNNEAETQSSSSSASTVRVPRCTAASGNTQHVLLPGSRDNKVVAYMDDSPGGTGKWVVSADFSMKLNCFPGNPPGGGYPDSDFVPGSPEGQYCVASTNTAIQASRPGSPVFPRGSFVGYGKFLKSCEWSTYTYPTANSTPPPKLQLTSLPANPDVSKTAYQYYNNANKDYLATATVGEGRAEGYVTNTKKGLSTFKVFDPNKSTANGKTTLIRCNLSGKHYVDTLVPGQSSCQEGGRSEGTIGTIYSPALRAARLNSASKALYRCKDSASGAFYVANACYGDVSRKHLGWQP